MDALVPPATTSSAVVTVPNVTSGWNRTENVTANTEHCSVFNMPAHPAFMCAYGLVFLVGLVLNAITMRVYFCKPQRSRSSVTIYLKNLAVSDFFLSLCLPLRIANYGTDSNRIRHVFCNFGATAFYLNMYASILFMDYIAADRYLKIVRPLESHFLQTTRAARYVSMATWISLSASGCSYMILSLRTTWGADLIPGEPGCEALHSPQLSMLYKIIHIASAAVFLFVLVSLVLLYRGTVRHLQRARRASLVNPGCKSLGRSKRNMLVLVGVFCVCFVPYHLVRVPYAFLKPALRQHCVWKQAFYCLKELTLLLSVLNACLDPVIYFLFCKAFRAQLGWRSSQIRTDDAAQVAHRRPSRSSVYTTRNDKVYILN